MKKKLVNIILCVLMSITSITLHSMRRTTRLLTFNNTSSKNSQKLSPFSHLLFKPEPLSINTAKKMRRRMHDNESELQRTEAGLLTLACSGQELHEKTKRYTRRGWYCLVGACAYVFWEKHLPDAFSYIPGIVMVTQWGMACYLSYSKGDHTKSKELLVRNLKTIDELSGMKWSMTLEAQMKSENTAYDPLSMATMLDTLRAHRATHAAHLHKAIRDDEQKISEVCQRR